MGISCRLVWLVLFCGLALGYSRDASWSRSDCQYRLTFEVMATQSGWHEVPLSPSVLLDKASGFCGFAFRPTSFNANRVYVSLLQGGEEQSLSNAGYMLLTDERELIPPGLKLPAQKGQGEGANEQNGTLMHLINTSHLRGWTCPAL